MFALLMCLASWSVIAQTDEFKINGQVTFTADAYPVPGAPVTFVSSDGSYFETTTTDNDGNYEVILDIGIGEQVTATGEVIDFCTGQSLAVTVDNSQSLEVVADFAICDSIFPPPPNTDCEAFYDYIQPDPAALTLEFTDLSYAGVTINSWTWDFGDGNTDSGQQVSHTFVAEGSYSVNLTIVADSCTSEITQIINVGVDTTSNCGCTFEFDPVCVLDASGELLPFPNECVAICEGYSTSDFVDCNGGCGCTTEYDPVCVDVDGSGFQIEFPNECEAFCAGFDSTNIVVCDTIPPGCPCPTFIDPVCVIAANGDTLTFDNFCYAECEGYTSDTWFDCGNGGNGCGCTTEYDPVCVDLGGLQIEFPNECEAFCAGFDSTYIVVCDTIPPGCPCPTFIDPVCVIAANGDTLTFDNFCYAECEGYTPDTWFDCGNGGNGCGCTTEYDPVCVDLGGFQIEFPNECEAFCAGFDSTYIVVCDTTYSNCWIDFSYYQSDSTGLEVTFEAIGALGTITSYLWDFGDGNTSTEENPAHVYAVEGIYDVTLTVEFADGCVYTITNHICIGGGGVINNPPDCQAFFWFEQGDSSQLNTFTFQDLSMGSDLEYSWDFGNGNTSTEMNPTHTYAEPGNYTVTLSVSNDSCSSSFSMFIFTDPSGWYNDECNALFLPALDSSLTVVFINLSSPDVLTTEWDFGDGNISDEAFPVHTYAAEGTYNVALTITTVDGCTSTFTMIVDLADFNFAGNPSYRTTAVNNLEIIKGAKLFPNPVHDELNISLSVEEGGEGALSIIDLSGRVVAQQTQPFVQGENVIQLNVSDLPEGIFFSRITLEEQVVSMKFVK